MDTLCEFEHQGRRLAIAAVEEEWPMAAVPGLPGKAVSAPSGVTLGPITLSATAIAPGDTLTLSAQVGGLDVVFVYLELLLRDPRAEQYYGPVCREPVTAPQTKMIGGVELSDWSQAPVAQVTIRPFLRLLTDSRDRALGFVRPRAPKAPSARAGYTLEALYRPAWGRRHHRAQVSFDEAGESKSVLVFHGLAGGAAPRSVNPRHGDRFIPLLRLYRPAGEAGAVEEKAVVQGNTLKWRGSLQCKAEPLLPGTYLAGLVAEDLDGRLHRRYAPLVVQGSEQ